MAKAGEKTTPEERLRKLLAEPKFAAAAERLSRRRNLTKDDLARAAESIFGSIDRHRAKLGPQQVTTKAATLPRPRKKPQGDRVKSAIKKLYVNGVADGIRTEAVRAAVTKALAADSRQRGLADPSWDVVARALGRRSR